LEDCFWSLYNTTEQVRIDGLRTIQLQGILVCLNRKNLDEYMVWQEGTDDWVPAGSIYDRVLEASQLFNMPPNPPEIQAEQAAGFSSEPSDPDRQILHKLTGTATSVTPETEEPQVAPPPVPESPDEKHTVEKKKTDVRMSPRFMIAFKVFLTYNGRVMKNETLNISVGGMKLKKPLDVDATGSVEVMLMHNGNELNMQCKILKDEGPNVDPTIGATRLFIEKCNRMDILRAWILGGNHKIVG
jgi:hypothetical protein